MFNVSQEAKLSFKVTFVVLGLVGYNNISFTNFFANLSNHIFGNAHYTFKAVCTDIPHHRVLGRELVRMMAKTQKLQQRLQNTRNFL